MVHLIGFNIFKKTKNIKIGIIKMNEFEQTHINLAHQSNFRVISILTEDLMPAIESGDVDRINNKLLLLLTQANYTSRNLGGVLTPNGSKETDQRSALREAIEVVDKFKKVSKIKSVK